MFWSLAPGLLSVVLHKINEMKIKIFSPLCALVERKFKFFSAMRALRVARVQNYVWQDCIYKNSKFQFLDFELTYSVG